MDDFNMLIMLLKPLVDMFGAVKSQTSTKYQPPSDAMVTETALVLLLQRRSQPTFTEPILESAAYRRNIRNLYKNSESSNINSAMHADKPRHYILMHFTGLSANPEARLPLPKNVN